MRSLIQLLVAILLNSCCTHRDADLTSLAPKMLVRAGHGAQVQYLIFGVYEEEKKRKKRRKEKRKEKKFRTIFIALVVVWLKVFVRVLARRLGRFVEYRILTEVQRIFRRVRCLDQ